MGAPIGRFIAATNINRTVPDYLESGEYKTRHSLATISNAMDVGAPSNFERIAAHFSWEELRHLVLGAAVTDDETRETVGRVYGLGYYLDPHTAVGWRAAEKVERAGALGKAKAAVISTAHPAKFSEALAMLETPVQFPPSLKSVMERKIITRGIPASLDALIAALI
jgi:threonine synthase